MTQYIKKSVTGHFDLFDLYDDVKAELITSYNKRQEELLKIASSLYDVLVREQRNRRERCPSYLLDTVFEKTSSRITGGRYVDYLIDVEDFDGTAIFVFDQVRVDFFEKQRIEKALLKEVDGEIRLRKPRKTHFPSFKEKPGHYDVNFGILTFNDNTKSINVEANEKYGFTRFYHSYNGRRFYRMMKAMDKAGKLDGLKGGYLQIVCKESKTRYSVTTEAFGDFYQ